MNTYNNLFSAIDINAPFRTKVEQMATAVHTFYQNGNSFPDGSSFLVFKYRKSMFYAELELPDDPQERRLCFIRYAAWAIVNKVTDAVFASEIWISDSKRNIRPSEDPKRTDGLIIIGVDKTNEYFAMTPMNDIGNEVSQVEARPRTDDSLFNMLAPVRKASKKQFRACANMLLLGHLSIFSNVVAGRADGSICAIPDDTGFGTLHFIGNNV